MEAGDADGGEPRVGDEVGEPNREPEEPPRAVGRRERAWSLSTMQLARVIVLPSRRPRAEGRTPAAARPSSVSSARRRRVTLWYEIMCGVRCGCMTSRAEVIPAGGAGPVRDIGLRVCETRVNTPAYCRVGGVGRTPVEENGLFWWEESGAF